MNKAVRKYLERHAEPEAHGGAVLARQVAPYAAVLVIPAYGEGASLFRVVEGVPSCERGRVCVVVVVNEPSDAPREARDANARTLAGLLPRTPHALHTGITIGRDAGRDVVLIDRTGPRALPARQGVGMARKIGADFALALGQSGGCRSSWIHCSDADVTLPRDYFDRRLPAAAAALYDFRHEGAAAVLEYEISLRYAVLGLHAAGSPWAWHAIGSTLTVDAAAYAKVRGFPRRRAAEDFHLLAKLAKVGAVQAVRGEPIRLDDRASQRVPFGTGRAMLRAQQRAERGEPLRVPDPRSYGWLAAWLDALARLGRAPGLAPGDALAEAARERGLEVEMLGAALDSIGALEAAEKIVRKRADPRRSLNESFDALASLRLLHALRDRVHPEVPLADALAAAPFLDREVADVAPDLEAVRCALVRQERRCLR